MGQWRGLCRPAPLVYHAPQMSMGFLAFLVIRVRLMKQTVAFEKNARNVFFHLLTHCNLACSHCYINPEQHGRHALPLADIRAWLAALADSSRPSNVIFLGGEPTLHPDLAPAVRAARQLGYASITVDTNGFLFHDILEKVTPGEVDFFSFFPGRAGRRVQRRPAGPGLF